MIARLRQLLLAATLAAAVGLPTVGLPSIARAQYHQPEVGSLNREMLPYLPGVEVGVDEKLGSFVPNDLQLVDEDGNTVTIGSYLNHERPVILWLGYYECPMLCDQMSAGMVEAVKGVRLDAGKEFSILNVSIDPNESATLAKAKKKTYLEKLGQPGNAAAWNLLTASPESIKTLSDSVGYKFKQVDNKGQREFAHPAVLIVLSPAGKVTRYLYPDGAKTGVAFDSRSMQLSLIEASEGKVGSVIDRVILTCLEWDSHAGKYTKNAIAMMKWAGGITVFAMAAVFVPIWIRGAKPQASQTKR